MSIPLRRGVHGPLEEAANAIIKESLQGVTRRSEKSDILTPWKERERYSREVYQASGSPDAMIRKGTFYKSANPSRPDLNSREGVVRARRTSTSLGAFVEENGDGSGFSGFGT